MRLIPPLGGPERKLTEIRSTGRGLRAVTLAWCPDSTCLVVTDAIGASVQDALVLVSIDSGEKRPLTTPPPGGIDSDPAISPDGRWLVFRRDAGPFTGELYRIALGSGLTPTGEPYRLTETALSAYSPRWLPGSTEILFSARGRLWRLAIAADRPAERLPIGEDGLTPVVSLAQAGARPRLVYVRSFSNVNLWRVDMLAPGGAAASAPRPAISSTRTAGSPQFSPDGRRVAFASTRSGENEIWLADPDGSNAVQLTAMAANPGFPRWSPDGRSIAFHSNPDGQAEIFVVAAEGGRPRNLTNHPALDTFPCVLARRPLDLLQLGPRRRATDLEDTGEGGTATPVSPGGGVVAIESTRRRLAVLQ